MTQFQIINRQEIIDALASMVIEQAERHGFKIEIDAIRDAVEQMAKFAGIEANEAEFMLASQKVENEARLMGKLSEKSGETARDVSVTSLELQRDSPVSWFGSSRWTFDRGAMPGEPFAFLDGDKDTSVAAMVEIQTPGKPVCYEVRKVDGILLSKADFPSEAAEVAEREVQGEEKASFHINPMAMTDKSFKVVFPSYCSDGPGYAGTLTFEFDEDRITLTAGESLTWTLPQPLPQILGVRDYRDEDLPFLEANLCVEDRVYLEDADGNLCLDNDRVKILDHVDGQVGALLVHGEPCFFSLVCGGTRYAVNETDVIAY